MRGKAQGVPDSGLWPLLQLLLTTTRCHPLCVQIEVRQRAHPSEVVLLSAGEEKFHSLSTDYSRVLCRFSRDLIPSPCVPFHTKGWLLVPTFPENTA